jgi:hypothetical protein
MIRDGHFWAEAPIYALVYDVHSMLALAEAARHYDGTDFVQLGFQEEWRLYQVGD